MYGLGVSNVSQWGHGEGTARVHYLHKEIGLTASSTGNEVTNAIAELDKVRREWLRRRGVTGLDVGLLWQGDLISREVGIRVKVEKKLDLRDVPAGELFPDHLGMFRVQVLEEAAPVPEAATEGERLARGESSPC